MGNFDFIRADWPEIATEAARAEFYTVGDPRSSLFCGPPHRRTRRHRAV